MNTLCFIVALIVGRQFLGAVLQDRFGNLIAIGSKDVDAEHFKGLRIRQRDAKKDGDRYNDFKNGRVHLN